MKLIETRYLRPLLAASLALGLCFCLPAPASAADSVSPADGKKVNINQASAEQLAYLPRVGAKAAQKVVDYRKSKGPFARPEDLMEVKGFGEKKFEQLKPYLTVSGPTTLDSKVSSAGSRGSKSRGNGKGKGRGNGKGASNKQAVQKASDSDTQADTAPVGKGQ